MTPPGDPISRVTLNAQNNRNLQSFVYYPNGNSAFKAWSIFNGRLFTLAK
jgi:hypothetical protein